MVKRKGRAKEALNLKRFRESVKQLGNSATKKENDSDSQEEHEHEQESEQPRKRSRKLVRKEQRQLKKMRQNAFQRRDKLPTVESLEEERVVKRKVIDGMIKRQEKRQERRERRTAEKEVEAKETVETERKQHQAAQNDDKAIRRLEKQLKMKKRKNNSLPQAFLDDGLDYILNAIDGGDGIHGEESDSSDQQADETGSETGSDEQQSSVSSEGEEDDDEDGEDGDDSDLSEDYDMSAEEEEAEEDDDQMKVRPPRATFDIEPEKSSLSKATGRKTNKTVSFGNISSEEEDEEMEEEEGDISSEHDNDDEDIEDGDDDESKNSAPKEDIYGRVRDSSGTVVTGANYIPPALRAKQVSANQSDKKRLELSRMAKLLKGLINRLSESNLQSICAQVESMYRQHSRADTSEALSALMFDACISAVRIPERLITEHVMLVALLHSNVGNEIGAVFLQTFAERFDRKHLLVKQGLIEDKELDNLMVFLAQLCNFKIVHCLLVFDVIKRLTASFTPKDVDLLLTLIKNAGFTLRKEDAASLKSVIVEIQAKCASINIEDTDNKSRTQYMLEILSEIRNNNFRKIPSFDANHLEHQKKMIKNFQRAGASSQDALRISLDDLLNSSSKGKWWLVGSAWTGSESSQLQPIANSANTSLMSAVTDDISAEILELARQQRMNTDIRRTIFCILLTSEDYTDAFTKLLKLGLKQKQEHEIMRITLDVCLQEKSFNLYYALIAQKFCELHRRHQMTIQFNMWDKFKELESFSEHQLKNISSFLVHLLSVKAISLSVFKVIEFSELDKAKVRFMKKVFEQLLLKHDPDTVHSVFERISQSEKLHTLREGLRLFLRHFLLRKTKDENVKNELKKRIKLAERAMCLEGNTVM